MTQESYLPNPETSVEAVSIFQPYEPMLHAFRDKVGKGDIVMVPSSGEIDVDTGTVWLGRNDREYIDPDQKTRVYEWLQTQENKHLTMSRDDMLSSSMSEDLKAALAEAIDKQEINSAFDFTFAQNSTGTWWVTQPSMREMDPWLQDAELVDFTEVRVGDNRIAVSFFTDQVDPEEVSDGISEVAATLAAAGLDLSDKIRWINVVDENIYVDFKVPPQILEKFPTAYVAAMARNSRSEIKLNAKMFKSNYDKRNEDGQKLSHARNWRDTLVHEIGHLYNMGLNDMTDASPAVDIGWRRRDAIITDDYGNLIELRDSANWADSSRYVMDDYGNEVFIGAVKAAHQLLSGGLDAEGKLIEPPTRYASESSHEDIAESFAAYFAGDPLDGVRRAAIEKIIASNRTLETGDVPEVSVDRIKPSDVDIWSYLPRHIRFRPAKIYL